LVDSNCGTGLVFSCMVILLGEGQISEVLSPWSSRRHIRIKPAERGGDVLHAAAQGEIKA